MSNFVDVEWAAGQLVFVQRHQVDVEPVRRVIQPRPVFLGNARVKGDEDE